MLCLTTALVGVGISYIKLPINHNAQTYSSLIIDSHANYFIAFSKGERYYAYYKDNPYEIGDYVLIEGNVEPIDFVTNESQFDFEDYLNKKGVYYSINVKSIEVKFTNPIRIKSRRTQFLNHFSEDKRALISSLLFSERLESEDIVNAEKLHLLRLMSASGIYIYSYLHLLVFILSKFIKDKYAKILSIGVLIPYFIFTFPRFAIIRILMMEIMKWINKYPLKGKFVYQEIVGFAGILFLLFDFHLGYQTSFIIGFSLSIIISFINDAVINVKRWKKKLATIILVYLLLIPFELQFYNGINPLSIPLQTILSPLFILVAGLSFLCFYGVPLYYLVSPLVKFLSGILSFLAKYSFQINAPPFADWMILVYVLVFLAYLYYRNIYFIPIYRLLMTLFIGALAIYHLPLFNLISAQVSFIDVGQGDSCLLRKGNTAVLIDTGGNVYKDLATETLIPFFQKNRIYDIDLVITTHDDYDHCGAYQSLNEHFYVKNLVTESTDFPIIIGGMTFVNYNNHTNSSEENDNSLVIGFRLLNKDFLITGDASIKAEKTIMKEYINIPCDILKVGHHGSKTSSSDEFIKWLSPKDAIISVGKNNKYGHPNNVVLYTLKKYNVNILRTDELGTITYKGLSFI